MAKGKKATVAEAELMMKLYDLRRESELRRARKFVIFEFQPKSADDIVKLSQAMGTQENSWMRQCTSYWENAASILLHGVVAPELFFEWNGEMVFLYAKFQPFLKELREKTGFPIMARMEKAVNSSPEMKKQVQMIQQRLAQMAAAPKAQTAGARA